MDHLAQITKSHQHLLRHTHTHTHTELKVYHREGLVINKCLYIDSG